MTISARRLNRATLQRQLLLHRAAVPAAEAMRQILAVQAQEAASPYLALWNRVAGFDPAELDAAFADGTVVKATLMRMTLHAAHRDDHASLYRAMSVALLPARGGDAELHEAEQVLTRLEEHVPALQEFLGSPRSRAELDAWFEGQLADAAEARPWRALRSYPPVVHAPTGGPWSFGPRPAYGAGRGRADRRDRSAAVADLVRRYLAAFGPATLADAAAFTRLTRARMRAAVADLGDEIVTLSGPGGTTLLDVRDAELPDEDVPAPPRLMAMWDNTLLAFDDRTRIVSDEYRAHIVRSNGDTLPTLLVDGRVAGVWRPVGDAIEATAFHRLDEDDWAGLAAEAHDLVRLLAERDPTVYRRYGRWWDKLPAADVRLLPG